MGIRKPIVIALVAGSVSLALADEPVQPPALKKRAVALGYAGSLVGVDVPRNGDDKLDPGGLGVFGRLDLRGGWGLQIGYSLKDKALGAGGEISVAPGGPRWGLLFNACWTFVDVELIPGQKESVNVSAGFLGLVFCF